MRKWLKRTGYTLLFLFVVINIMASIQAYHATRFYDELIPKKHINEMSFSEKLSAVFFGVKVSKSIVVDSLKPLHNEVTITTEDGLKLACWYMDASVEVKKNGIGLIPARGTVIMFHGHASNRSGMIKEAEAFYNMGYNVLMVDFRAHGQSEGNTCTIGYEESKDVKAAYDYIASQKEKNIILWGISLGSSAIIKAIYDYDEIKPSKIILEMPFATLFDAVKGFTRVNHVPEEPVAVLLTFWGGVEHGFWAFGMKSEEYAKKIKCPVLLQRGIDDIRVTEEETKAIYQNIPSTDKTLIEYADCGHESLYKKDPLKWTMTVTTFLSNH